MDGKNAQRSDEITDEMWNEVNPYNREIVQEFLDNQSELAIKTKIGYESGLRIFFYWVKEHLHDKNFNEIKKKEFVKYLNWLTNKHLVSQLYFIEQSSSLLFCSILPIKDKFYKGSCNFGCKALLCGKYSHRLRFSLEKF